MLWMFQRVNYGEITNVKNRTLPDLTPREWALMVPTIAVAILMGVFPGVFLKPMEPAVKRTIERVTGRSFASDLPPAHSRLAASDGSARTPDPVSRATDRGSRTPDPGARAIDAMRAVK
jgi:NADH-quinone oxidoreductase subunit M